MYERCVSDEFPAAFYPLGVGVITVLVLYGVLNVIPSALGTAFVSENIDARYRGFRDIPAFDSVYFSFATADF